MSEVKKLNKSRIEKMRQRYASSNVGSLLEGVLEKVSKQTPEQKNTNENMEDFLIYLAKHAAEDRYYPFPDKYRITSKPGGVYTTEEFKILHDHLQSLDQHQALKSSIINIDLGIVKHDKSSIHETIIEYEFKYPELDELKRNIRYKKRWYLFHGSPVGNWHSILRTGIKNMSGTRFMSSGSAFGPGVYLASDINIAYDYGGCGSKHCIAVVEILIDPAPYNKGMCYVIPDDTILFPRYLLQINKRPNFDGHEIYNIIKN